MKKKSILFKVLTLVLSMCLMLTSLSFVSPVQAVVDTKTSENVQKVMDYALQMKDANPRPGTIGWANGQYTWDTESKKSTWRYFNGVMMDAFLMTGNSELRTYVEAFYNGNIENDSTPIVESTDPTCNANQRGYILNELDSVVSARPLFDLLNTSNAEKYKTAIKYVYDQLKQQGTYSECGGNYVHKQTGPATNGKPNPTSSWSTYPIGLDGLYMAETFLMDCAKAIEAGSIDLGVTAESIYDEVFTRFHWVAENMYDKTTGLYHHGYNPETRTGNNHFWSRGIGWYAMALVDTIEMMPEGTNKETLKTDLVTLFDGMLKYQDASTGMWYNVVNKDSSLTANNDEKFNGNKLETSGSSMMAYALMKAYNNGYVGKTYGEAGLKAFNGVVSNKLQGNKGSYKVVDTYRSSGVETTDAGYCKNPYTTDEAKGTAALIMTSTLASTVSDSLGIAANQPVVSEPVIDETPVTVNGTIPGTVQYELDTNGIDLNETYLVVNSKSDGTRYAVRNNNGTVTRQSVTISTTNKKTIATINDNVSQCEWKITDKSDQGDNMYSIANGGKYLSPSNSTLLSGAAKITGPSSSGYKITDKTGNKYLKYSSNKWISKQKESDEEIASTVYLYKKVESEGTPVVLSANPSSVTFNKGDTQNISYTITVNGKVANSSDFKWTSSNSEIATVENGVITGVKAGTTYIVGTVTTVNGKKLASSISVRIRVTVNQPSNGNPYEELNPATDYPVYPADGAVRINKTATSTDFQSTGVTKVELTTAGISVKQGIDVVLVVDVSNSMAWTDDWFLTNPTANEDYLKIPSNKDAANPTDKLDIAMQSASKFADILLKDNVPGSTTNNTISFVTFAGFDAQNTKETGDKASYIDSVQTVFTKVEDINKAQTAFNNTKFTNYKVDSTNNKVAYTLQISDENGQTVSGTNRGNTNYDYAFAQANEAVKTIQGTNYAETGRDTIVVFMTDGAPSHYNDDRANGTDNDYKYGTTQVYNAIISDPTANNWLNNYLNAENKYAVQLNKNISDFYAVGFDLNHGGFGSLSWTQEQLQPVLEGLAGPDSVSVKLADSGSALETFYINLANNLKFAGTNAKVTDIIDSNFTLDMKPSSTIDVIAYDLYTKSETNDSTKIGTRSGSKEVLETITFNSDGTVHSNKINGNIISNAEGKTVIKAQYFTYTKDTSGTETFVWNIGDITDKELALSYYAYLKGSMEGSAKEGIYNTNESAILEYVDINGNYAIQTYRKPTVSWGSAITKVEFYLVNENGEPINYAGDVIPFANRIVISHSGEPRIFNWNQEVTIRGAGYVPNGYALYETDPQYTVIAYSGNQAESKLEIKGNDSTTQRIDSDPSCANTAVAFAVVATEIKQADYELKANKVVVDYGKPLLTNVLANDANVIPSGFTASIVGFAQYTNDAILTNMQTNKGTAIYTGDFGLFSIENNQVKYSLTKMLDKVERIFVVVQMTNDKNQNDYYYMYQQLEVIPATIMYYESDFANVFTLTDSNTNTWNKVGTPSNSYQDDGDVELNQTYGYDSSYNNGSTHYSNGSSERIDNTSSTQVATAEFDFKGTGFDIISATGPQQGLINVIVTDKDGNKVKNVSVLNKGESDGNNENLHQIPVMSIEDLTYGQYHVTIKCLGAYTGSYTALQRGGQFYFDAIRVYNPYNTADTSADSIMVNEVYSSHGEANSEIIELRNKIIDQNTFDSTNTNNGVVFLDNNGLKGNVSNYVNAGPNNEVYLLNGQAIAFTLDTTNVTSLDLGAKCINEKTANLKVVINGAEYTKYITSGTQQFISLDDIKCTGNVNVVITNTDATNGSILSLTDLKVCKEATSTPVTTSLYSTMSLVTYACNVLAGPNYDINSVSFTSTKAKLLRNTTMMVETSDDVATLKVTNKYGMSVPAKISSTTVDGITTWTVKINPGLLGTQTYTVTGYGEDGTAGASMSASIKVTLF